MKKPKCTLFRTPPRCSSTRCPSSQPSSHEASTSSRPTFQRVLHEGIRVNRKTSASTISNLGCTAGGTRVSHDRTKPEMTAKDETEDSWSAEVAENVNIDFCMRYTWLLDDLFITAKKNNQHKAKYIRHRTNHDTPSPVGTKLSKLVPGVSTQSHLRLVTQREGHATATLAPSMRLRVVVNLKGRADQFRRKHDCSSFCQIKRYRIDDNIRCSFFLDQSNKHLSAL